MERRLVYVPIEAYQSRYTEYTSVAGGIYETIFKANKVPFVSIRPDMTVKSIKTGRVLDAVGRAHWGFVQTETLMQALEDKRVLPTDAIYIEDFWHPGMEMIPYIQQLLDGEIENSSSVFAFCHAQSTDPHDFTFPMRHWMRHFEQGWLVALNKVFCAAVQMRQQWIAGGLNAGKLYPIGHIFDADTVIRLSGVQPTPAPKDKEVVYSSRLDTEKNPLFFVEVAEQILAKRSDIHFTFCTGLPGIRSNDPKIKSEIYKFINRHEANAVFAANLTKSQYFKILNRAAVQFNCADQDFISYTLLDAALYNCAPLYPAYLTFPDALNRSLDNLYNKGDVADAVAHLEHLIDSPPKDYSWIWKKYQSSGRRLLEAMGFPVTSAPSIAVLNAAKPEQLQDLFTDLHTWAV
jgi:glycosyltransferase involved in cell wall biosynthesis